MKKILKPSIILLILIIGLSINSISKATNTNTLKWDLYFENIEVVEGSVIANEEASIVGASNCEINFDVTLNLPGDFYEFTVDIVNNGTIDAMIDEIKINNLSEDQEKYLAYAVSYLNGEIVKSNDVLSAGTRKTIRVNISYSEEVVTDALPSADADVTFSLRASYVQAEPKPEPEPENVVESEPNPENKVEPTKPENKVKPNNESAHNAKTGDGITQYIIIFALGIVALIISLIKTDDKDNKEVINKEKTEDINDKDEKKD